MRLVVKVFAVLAAVTTLLVALNYAVLRNTVLPAFVALEQTNSEENMRRVIDAIEGELRGLRSTARDWAFWHDSYEFVLDEPAGYRAEYMDANLDAESLVAVNLDAMLILDGAGRVIWGMVLEAGTDVEIQVDELSRASFPADSPLLHHPRLDGVVSGILRTGRGPLLTASVPILTSNRSGPAAGTIIIGRFLSGRTEAALRDQTHVDFELMSPDREVLEQHALGDLANSDGQQALWTDVDGDTTNVFALLRDVTDAPVLLVHARSPRDIVAIGAQSTRIALISLLIVSLVLIAATGLMLQSVVLSPIVGLTRHVLAIKCTGDLSQRISNRKTDEIGILSDEFDNMMVELSDARRELLERSYKAGIAEMAAGVLHSIRNQLNPVTMKLGVLRRRISAASPAKTLRALEELDADASLSERSAKLVRFLKLSADHAVRERENLLTDLNGLSRQFSRVDDVLRDQDRFALASRVVEPVVLAEVVGAAVDLVSGLQEGDIEVVIDPGLADVAPVSADRLVLTHVLRALLTNGVEAIGGGGTGTGRIEVTVSNARGSDGSDEIDLTIADNGRGIGADALDRIFERGYSTKRGSGSGFGLHWCANTIVDRGGRIYAESPGPERGASIHIILPTAAKTAQAAA